MNEGPSNITNPIKNWKQEQVLWAAILVLGIIIILLIMLNVNRPKNAPPPPPSPSSVGSVTETATPSPSVTVSMLPTLEELPYESTRADAGFNPSDYALTPEESVEPTETPTFYMRYVTSTRTPTQRFSGGGSGGGGGSSGGGGFHFSSWTPNKTLTAYYVNASKTATFLKPTRMTATYVYGQTATIAIQLTNIARTPRPQQIAYSDGGNIHLLDTTPSPTPKPGVNTPTPGPTPWTIPGNMGDWNPDGLRFVYENGGRLFIQWLNPNGTLRAAPSGVPGDGPATSTGAIMIRNQPDGNNTHPAWSPNRAWIVFRNDGPEPGLYRMDQTGQAVQRLTTNANDQMPDWNTDGSQIVFISNGDIFVMPVSPWPPVFGATPTGAVTPTFTPTPVAARTQITRTTATESWPHYSPDGKYLLYARDDGQSNIYLLDISQQFVGNPVQLTGTGTATEPFWTRTISYFIYVVDRVTIVIQDKYGNPVPAGTQDSADKLYPRWRP